MDGRAFLAVAKELVQGQTEAHWRAAVGRAYYALMLEGRGALGRWGFPVPPRDQVHTFVRLRFLYSQDTELENVGKTLGWLGQFRNRADYQLASTSEFSTRKQATLAVQEAENNLARLDKLAQEPTRLAAVIAAIRTQFP